MSCISDCIKYLLFIFNFIFLICGLAILTLGVIVHLRVSEITDHIDTNLLFPSITLIVIGSIIFIISFFGCCGAIRESHCMTITFASFLLFILIVQVAVAVYVFVVVKNSDDKIDISENYEKIFKNYGTDKESTRVIDIVQSSLHCCGVYSSKDFILHNLRIPPSCCGLAENQTCSSNDVYEVGCVPELRQAISNAGTVLGSLAIAIAGVELIGIIFALCLANSIRNAERRNQRNIY
ncbi:CD63 antigen-like isoform X2 [Bombus vosnesenskii]|uniref:Tetraspanin n=2 Tax=Pyrobombus TaxID=144703 RepID=A0A6J3KQU6_9HYME|nr:CD63 antigen-like isoform X2 [Bombus vancouverensis nearcticus]XP_033305200.1 CD63 antigen-like isoform X2 [Bombus bifarius]XP_033354471.1 CD63 antigen-like isoform X2 [Bombus vosnesenskii]XP_050485851.1 CD63 antigen-like isoform X2 [Bombus huntii]